MAALLGAAALFALGFVAVYALDRLPAETQLLGACLGLSLGCVAAALGVYARRLVPPLEGAEEYPPTVDEQAAADAGFAVRQLGAGLDRRRLLAAACLAAGGALTAALLVPVASLGPFLETARLRRSPWRRGVRLVDSAGRPLRAGDVPARTLVTAFPEGADRDEIGSPVVVVRIEPGLLRLPRERARWAPAGLVAYSKVCTHAGCAVSLYRVPKWPQSGPRAALVCPCHYSAFDPAAAGDVVAGPAGRPLPQLPLLLDGDGGLRAAGPLSAAPGPSWWDARARATS